MKPSLLSMRNLTVRVYAFLKLLKLVFSGLVLTEMLSHSVLLVSLHEKCFSKDVI